MIRNTGEYFEARLAGARITVQVDIGFGDAVVPAPEVVSYPVLLDLPVPRIRVYPREVVVAEKFQSMVMLGIANSRMKDFFDIWMLAFIFEFSGQRLSQAIKATFDRRRTAIPSEAPLALTDAFYGDAAKQVQWNAFLRKGLLKIREANFESVVTVLREFLMPPTRALAQNKEFRAEWPAGGPWA